MESEHEVVFVMDGAYKPLLPTHPARARRLLREGKAAVYQVVPFTIQLKRVVEGPVGAFTVGVDDGAQTVGLAVVNEQTQEVVLQGEISLRQDVSRKLTQRAMYRRSRRTRKTRHRACRPHRHHATCRPAPSIRQKKDSVVRVVADLQRVLNIRRVVVEQGQFDTASLAAGRPLNGIEYQLPRYEGREFRAKVLWRDRYTCQHCGKRDRLQAHHIRPKAQGGSDTPDNGLTLCADCHAAVHAGQWVLDKPPRPFVYPAHLQSGKHYLVRQLADLGVQVDTYVGWMTQDWRAQLALDKRHSHDAIALVCRCYRPRVVGRHYLILPRRKKVWTQNPTKTCSEKLGFRHWDLVKAAHRTRGVVIGSVRSLKAKVMTLRTAWDDNFPVSYRKAKLLWRFNNLIYI